MISRAKRYGQNPSAIMHQKCSPFANITNISLPSISRGDRICKEYWMCNCGVRDAQWADTSRPTVESSGHDSFFGSLDEKYVIILALSIICMSWDSFAPRHRLIGPFLPVSRILPCASSGFIQAFSRKRSDHRSADSFVNILFSVLDWQHGSHHIHWRCALGVCGPTL